MLYFLKLSELNLCIRSIKLLCHYYMRIIGYLYLCSIIVTLISMILMAYSTLINTQDIENMITTKSDFTYSTPVKSQTYTGIKFPNQNKSLYENFEEKKDRKGNKNNTRKKVSHSLKKEKKRKGTQGRSVYRFIE